MMKRLVSVVCIMTLLLCTTMSAGFGSTTACASVVGDCDGDGNITIVDAVTVQRYLADIPMGNVIDVDAADADSDGSITITDSTRIQQYLAEICEMSGIPYGEVDPFDGENNIKLTVWAFDKAKNLTLDLCKEFKAKYPNKKISISVQSHDENDAASDVLNDIDSAADVFSLPCDMLSTLVRYQAIAPVADPAAVKARDSKSSVDAATLNGKLYAYPETADNGYYLVYDKSVVSDNDAKTFEGILSACRKANRKFVMDAGNGFYSCVFPFTGGLRLNGMKNDVQQFNNYDEDQVVDTLAAFAKLIHDYSDVFESNYDIKIASGMSSSPRTVAAGIDGTWNAKEVSNALGSNFGAVKLPTVKVNGTNEQMISLHGYKFICVKSTSKYPNAAQLLADYLADESAQIRRAADLSWGPSNNNATKNKAVTGNAALKAVVEQSKYSVPQVDMAPTFWTPMANLGNELYKGEKYDKATLRTLLRRTIANIKDE